MVRRARDRAPWKTIAPRPERAGAASVEAGKAARGAQEEHVVTEESRPGSAPDGGRQRCCMLLRELE